MRSRSQEHRPRFSWRASTRACRCGNTWPCLAGTSATPPARATAEPFPNATTVDVRTREIIAREQVLWAKTLAGTHQPDGNGWCRVEQAAQRWPCPVHLAALRQLAHHRAILALTGATEQVPVITRAGITLQPQVANSPRQEVPMSSNSF